MASAQSRSAEGKEGQSGECNSVKIEKSSGNIFADLGFNKAEASNLLVRSDLMRAIDEWFKASGLTQAKASQQLGFTQVRLNAMLKASIGQFSIDELVNMAASVGVTPKLTITSKKQKVA
jgi:predicted XRE-type DNA-binding protein